MIIRDLYRSPLEDLHKAIAGSTGAVLRRGAMAEPSDVALDDIERLAMHPHFDPSLSFVAYEAAEPVAFLVSHLDWSGGTAEAAWSLFGGASGARHALEVLLDEAMAQWRAAGAAHARKRAVGLLLTEPELAADAVLLEVLKQRGFEVTATSVVAAAELKKLATPKELADRADELRQKGYRIRPAEPHELLVIARQYDPRHVALHTQEFWNVVVAAMRPEATLAVEHRRQIVGFATFLGWTLEAPAPWLGPHFVDEVHRKPGLEAALLHEAALLAKQNGKEQARAFCAAGRTEAHQAAGFAVAGEFCHEAVADLA